MNYHGRKVLLTRQLNSYINLFVNSQVESPWRFTNEIISIMVEIHNINRMDLEMTYKKVYEPDIIIKSCLDEFDFTEEEISIYQIEQHGLE